MTDETIKTLEEILATLKEYYKYWQTVEDVQLGYKMAVRDLQTQINILREQNK